jgi:hypothetical protein
MLHVFFLHNSLQMNTLCKNQFCFARFKLMMFNDSFFARFILHLTIVTKPKIEPCNF